MRHLLFVGAALVTLLTIGCAGSPVNPGPTNSSAPIGSAIQNLPPWQMDPVLPAANSVVPAGTPYRVSGGVTGTDLWQWAVSATWLVRDDGRRLLVNCSSSSIPGGLAAGIPVGSHIGTFVYGTFNPGDRNYDFAKGHTLNATVLYEAWSSAPPAGLMNRSPTFCEIARELDTSAQRQNISLNWAIR